MHRSRANAWLGRGGRIRRWVWSGLLAWACVFAPCPHAAAQAPRVTQARGASAPESPRLDACGGAGAGVLEVTLLDVPEAREVHAAICDWFREGGWRVEFPVFHRLPAQTESAQRSEATLRVGITRPSAREAQLLLEVTGEREAATRRWERRVPLGNGLDDVGVEVLAQALHSLAQAAQQTKTAGSPRALTDEQVGDASSDSSRVRSLAESGWSPVREGSASDAALARVARPAGFERRQAARTEAMARPLQPTRAVQPVAPPSRPLLAARRPRSARRTLTPVVDGASASSPDQAEAPPDDAAITALTLRLGLGYQLYARGPEPATHGPLVRAELTAPFGRWSLGAFARAGLFTSASTLPQENLELRLSGASFVLGAAAQRPWAAFGARLAVAAGADVPELEVRTLDPEALRLLADTRPSARPFVGVETGLTWRSGQIEIGLLALVRWQLLASHYQVQRAGQLETLLRPWRLQPGGTLEVAYVW
jgi:hypothetical protein